MINVKISLESIGKERILFSADLPVLPRIGDNICLPDNEDSPCKATVVAVKHVFSHQSGEYAYSETEIGCVIDLP